MREDIAQKEDEEIIRLVQSGQIEFFGILIGRYESKMKRYGWKFLSDREDISDVLQDIFIKAYINIQGFDVKRKFSSWLYRIAHNELINALKKKNNKTLPLFNLDVFMPQHSSIDDLTRQMDNQMIDKCLDKLEPKYREPIILFYFEDLNYKEIADIMRIPISTVGIRIKRAKDIMKSIFKKLGYVYE